MEIAFQPDPLSLYQVGLLELLGQQVGPRLQLGALRHRALQRLNLLQQPQDSLVLGLLKEWRNLSGGGVGLQLSNLAVAHSGLIPVGKWVLFDPGSLGCGRGFGQLLDRNLIDLPRGWLYKLIVGGGPIAGNLLGNGESFGLGLVLIH